MSSSLPVLLNLGSSALNLASTLTGLAANVISIVNSFR